MGFEGADLGDRDDVVEVPGKAVPDQVIEKGRLSVGKNH